ncbi:MAG TPA: hypothetical protein VFG29_05770 [Syntrophales bacterium]|nr:hypothetical protein [Syntrophales bacterium]
MRENDTDVNIGVKTLDEVEALTSCILKYFKDKSESWPLKKDEALILSVLDRYFNAWRKY